VASEHRAPGTCNLCAEFAGVVWPGLEGEGMMVLEEGVAKEVLSLPGEALLCRLPHAASS
jgi:hypothetical protein